MCPKDEILSAFIDGEISTPWNKRLEAHIKHCPRCAERIEKYQGISHFLSVDTVSVKESMARVKNKIDFTLSTGVKDDFPEKKSFSTRIPFWGKQVAIPMPLLAAEFAVFFVLVASLFFLLGRNDTQVVRTNPDQDNSPNVHVYYQMNDPELLRKILTDEEYNQGETIINLPEENDFTIIGEPEVKRLIDSRGK